MNSEKSQKIWLGFAEKRPVGNGRVKINLFWGRILIVSFVLMIIGYLALTGGIYLLLKEKRGYARVTYADTLLLPIKQKEIKREQGLYQIERGQEIAESAKDSQDLLQAERWIRQGLSRAPDQIEGRPFLARMFMLRQQPNYALQTYEDGLPYAGRDLDFLRGYLQVLFVTKHEARALEVVQEYLPAQPDKSDKLNTLLAVAGMRAAVEVGEFQQAHQWYRDYGLDANPEAVLLAATALERVGRTDDAIDLLKSFVDRYDRPQFAEVMDAARKMLMTLYQRQERYGDAAEVGFKRSIVLSEDPQPSIDLLKVYDAQGREQDVQRVVENLLRQFGDDAKAVAALCNFATDTGRLDLVRRIYETAIEKNLELASFSLMFIEAHVTSGQFASGLAYIDDLVRENPDWLERQESVISGLRAIAHYGLNDEKMGDLYLTEFLSSARVRAGLLRNVAARFEDVGRPDLARRVLLDALEREPRDEQILTKLVDLELELGESRTITEHVGSLMDLVRPRLEKLETFYHGLNSDRFIFAPDREQRLEALASAIEQAETGNLDYSLRPLDVIQQERQMQAAAPQSEPVAAN